MQILGPCHKNSEFVGVEWRQGINSFNELSSDSDVDGL